MNIADILIAEFLAAGGDVERGRDRAADAATRYIARRLQQLERRFQRHAFAFSHQRNSARLSVYPRVARVNDVHSLLNLLCSRSTRWRTMAGLRRLEIDLRAVSYRTEQEFDRLLGYIRSSGDPLGRSPASMSADAARAYEHLVITSRLEDESRFNRRPADWPTASSRAAASPQRRNDRRMVHGRH